MQALTSVSYYATTYLVYIRKCHYFIPCTNPYRYKSSVARQTLPPVLYLYVKLPAVCITTTIFYFSLLPSCFFIYCYLLHGTHTPYPPVSILSIYATIYPSVYITTPIESFSLWPSCSCIYCYLPLCLYIIYVFILYTVSTSVHYCSHWILLLVSVFFLYLLLFTPRHTHKSVRYLFRPFLSIYYLFTRQPPLMCT